MRRAVLTSAAWGVFLVIGCKKSDPPPPLEEPRTAPAPSEPEVQLEARSDTPPSRVELKPEACPEGMADIPGGTFWVGSTGRTYGDEENPRFRTKVRGFCADVHEVTAAEYDACVSRGKCPGPAGTKQSRRCTSGQPGKEDHPINCITYAEAEAVCADRGARLPTEIEWEYLARGGAEMRKFPWGEASPDGHTCWKHSETCKVKSYEPGAFGLYDVGGNVWEWTSSWFAPYPWPAATGRHRVYRGGSWSRRFDKWMKPTLRSRGRPDDSGSHLGVRCVFDKPSEPCPYGSDEAGGCLFGVDEVECLDGKVWNGLRCAKAGATGCEEGAREVPGRGCVQERSSVLGSSNKGAAAQSAAKVARERSPSFDEDCRANQPSRPVAYKYTGGEHVERNQAGKRDGCKNRDVGVGWNSACCPN